MIYANSKMDYLRKTGNPSVLDLILLIHTAQEIGIGRADLSIQSNEAKNSTALLISSSDGCFLFIPPMIFQGP